MHYLENDILKIAIAEKGAELKEIVNKKTGLHYMWKGDPDYWAKTSPVLFPIVGALKNNEYYYNNITYSLPRHGFAREMVFEVSSEANDAASFTLKSNEFTLKHFPFDFNFSITYQINYNILTVTYKIISLSNTDMYFSIGGHPAFCVPLVNGTKYEDYELVFNEIENAGRWLVSKEGLIEAQTEPLLNNSNILPLKKELFYKDAIVLKNLKSDSVKLISNKTSHGLTFYFGQFPFLGLWAAPDADFLCIEPWCGIADSVNADQQLINKEGILHLKRNETFSEHWKVELF